MGSSFKRIRARADIRHVSRHRSEALPAALAERFARSIARAEGAIAERPAGVGEPADATSSPEYREIVLLKVKLELEVARILSSVARLGAELAETADGLQRRTEGFPP
jgi:hypothetical protein